GPPSRRACPGGSRGCPARPSGRAASRRAGRRSRSSAASGGLLAGHAGSMGHDPAAVQPPARRKTPARRANYPGKRARPLPTGHLPLYNPVQPPGRAAPPSTPAEVRMTTTAPRAAPPVTPSARWLALLLLLLPATAGAAEKTVDGLTIQVPAAV